MVDSFFKKILNVERKKIKSPDDIAIALDVRLVRVAACLVLCVSCYWLIIDRISDTYNLSVVAQSAVIAQLAMSGYMVFMPEISKNKSNRFIRNSFLFYYLVIIAGVSILTASRNIDIIQSGQISDNIGVSVSAFYLFIFAYMPIPDKRGSIFLVIAMVVGLSVPELFYRTSTYSLFAHVLLSLCFSATYHFYRKNLLSSASQEIEIERLNDVLMQNSYVDSLTGVLNRRSFDEYFEYLEKNQADSFVGVIFFDIDSFKKYNDNYGHSEGDLALQNVANAALQAIKNRSDCYLFRYGGEEFVVIQNNGDENALIETMKSIRTCVFDAHITRVDVKNFDRVTVTVGGAIEHVPNETGDYIIAADNQLYTGKASYRNCVYYKNECVDADEQKLLRTTGQFSLDPVSKYDERVVERNYWNQAFVDKFDRAIKNNDFEIYIQPKYDPITRAMTSAEALVRWIWEDGRILSPGQFIPVLEETGQIVALDEYVLESVANRQKQMREAGLNPVPISVNMSRNTLFQDGEIDRYNRIIKEVGIPKSLVPIEITESAAVDDIGIQNMVDTMNDEGFFLYMDDFGNGYSSLSNLSQLPFDAVKLDKSLIDDIGKKNGEEILRHIIELAHFLKLEVVAEGVENTDQLDFLIRLNCDTIQGYIFSKPLPMQEYHQIFEAVDNNGVEIFK